MSLLALLGTAGGQVAAGVGSSLLSNFIGARNTDKTNSMNLRINQMNNEFNERMMQKQMDYNTMMWEKQNAYNTPSAQIARYRAAGINPYMAMNGISSGSASSVGSTSAASAAPSAPQQAFHPDFIGIPQSIAQAHQNEFIKAQTQQQIIDNQTRAQRNLQDIANLFARTQNERIRHKLSSVQYGYADQMHKLQIHNQFLTNENLRATTNNIIREGLLKQKELDIFDERIKLEFAQRAADILNTKSNTAYTKQLQIHEIQKLYETCARTQGIKISNKTAKDMAEHLVEKARVEADLAPYTYGPQNMFSSAYGVGYQVDRNKR